MNEPDAELRWTVAAPPEMQRKKFVVFVVAAVATVIGVLALRNPIAGVFAGIAILGATSESWLGSSFRLDADGANARTGMSVTAIEWKDVKRVVFEANQALLSPLSEDGTLSQFRGVRLAFGDESSDQVRQFIQTHCGDHARFLG